MKLSVLRVPLHQQRLPLILWLRGPTSDLRNCHSLFSNEWFKSWGQAFGFLPPVLIFSSIKEDGKLLFRHFKEWTSLTLFSEELKLGIESGYEHKIESGLRFHSGSWMQKIFTDAVNKKAAAKSTGNTAMSTLLVPVLQNTVKRSTHVTEHVHGVHRASRPGLVPVNVWVLT